jgi:SprT protein
MNHPSLTLGEISDQQQHHKLQLMDVLKRYLPPIAVEYCSELIMNYKLHLHIEVERKGRLGDYSPHLGKGNRISINHNLNPYDFLITFVHELAHHTTFKKYGALHEAHGEEWKEEFKNCMRPFVMIKMFPDDILTPLIKHMKSPKYTHSGDVNLMKALMCYDKNKNYFTLDQLNLGDLFKMTSRSKIVMKKGEKRRTYFMCEAIETKKKYLVHAIAKVIPVK